MEPEEKQQNSEAINRKRANPEGSGGMGIDLGRYKDTVHQLGDDGTPGWGKNPGHEVEYSSHKVVGKPLEMSSL